MSFFADYKSIHVSHQFSLRAADILLSKSRVSRDWAHRHFGLLEPFEVACKNRPPAGYKVHELFHVSVSRVLQAQILCYGCSTFSFLLPAVVRSEVHSCEARKLENGVFQPFWTIHMIGLKVVG